MYIHTLKIVVLVLMMRYMRCIEKRFLKIINLFACYKNKILVNC